MEEKKQKQYNVNGQYKNGSDLTLDDVKILFQQFVDVNGYYPAGNKCNIGNNLPNSKLLAKILKANNILLNDWQNSFGKVSHVRSDVKYYNQYVDKYKEVCGQIGRPLTLKELKNNNYGLPSGMWLCTHCPDDCVKTYVDFIKWCGFKHQKIKEKDDVVKVLQELQKSLNRPIVKQDISLEKTGFSMIVINRIWGSLTNCKKELGLMATERACDIYTFEKYLIRLDNRLNEIKKRKAQNKSIME